MRREEKKEGVSLPIVCTAKSKADLMWVVGLWVGFFFGGGGFFSTSNLKKFLSNGIFPFSIGKG